MQRFLNRFLVVLELENYKKCVLKNLRLRGSLLSKTTPWKLFLWGEYRLVSGGLKILSSVNTHKFAINVFEKISAEGFSTVEVLPT